MKKIHLADAVFVLTTMIVCSSLITTMAAVTLFPGMMATPFAVATNRDCPLFCTGTDREMHNPICGSNGTANVSYDNECFMKVLNCRYNTNFIKIHEGLCKTTSNSISGSSEGATPAPADSFQTTTTGPDVPSSQTSFYGTMSNDSGSTNSYEVYENVQELAKQSNSTSSGVTNTTLSPTDSTQTPSGSATESFKSFENSDLMNFTTGTSGSTTTQESSNFDQITSASPIVKDTNNNNSTDENSMSLMTTQESSNFDQFTTQSPIVKDVNNNSSDGNSMTSFEVTTKFSENGSSITSETTFNRIPAISNSVESSTSGDNSQSTTVGSTPSSRFG